MRGVEAVHHRHDEIEYRDVRLELRRQVDGGLAVGGLSDDLEALTLQEKPERLSHYAMIVSQENANPHTVLQPPSPRGPSGPVSPTSG